MKKITKIVSTITGAAGTFLLTSPVFAQGLCANGSGFSPLCNGTANLPGVVQFIVNLAIFIGFVLALLYLIIGGIKWITAGGDKTQTEDAKKAVTGALIGLVIILAAYILVNVALSFFGLGSISNVNVPILNSATLNR